MSETLLPDHRFAGATSQQSREPFWKRHPLLLLAVVVSLVSTIYWLLIASNQYESEAHIIVQRADLPGGQAVEFSGLLSGVLGSTNHTDQLILQDYLNSVDLLKKVDAELGLKQHFSDSSHDFFSRLWRDEIEWFHRYYLKHVGVFFNDKSGILQLSARAFDPAMAQKILLALVKDSERFMNDLSHQLAVEQVRFLEGQVNQMKQQVISARQTLLAYQNKHGLVSPQASAEAMVSILAQLEGQRVELDAQRGALRAYLIADHPNIVRLDQQIASLDKQIAIERAKLAQPSGKSLNLKVEEFQRLQFDAVFAEEVYKTGLAALERGRVEAAHAAKKVVIVQNPTLPEYSDQLNRAYNALVYSLLAFLLAGITHLILAIVREHKD